MEIELLARAVIENEGRFLLAHTKGARNTFLPGGHIEQSESMRQALRRELLEELGVDVEIGDYIGIVEHSWIANGALTHEINHVFAVSAPGISVGTPPRSREDQVEFMWLSPNEFEAHNLQPAPLRELLRNWSENHPRAWWASTMKANDA